MEWSSEISKIIILFSLNSNVQLMFFYKSYYEINLYCVRISSQSSATCFREVLVLFQIIELGYRGTVLTMKR